MCRIHLGAELQTALTHFPLTLLRVTVQVLLLPPAPDAVPVPVVPPWSRSRVHTSFCLFTCFPFVRLLSILVEQRTLFVWK